MELFDAIMRRRSVRSFGEKEVEPYKIERLLKAAFWSPSSGGFKSINLFIIKDREIIRLLSRLTSNSAVLRASNTVIVIGYDSESGRNFIEDTSMAAMSIMLAATDMELGSCYVQFLEEDGLYGDPEIFIKKKLNVPEKIRILGAIGLGYTLQKDIKTHTDSEILRKNVHYELYGIH